MSNLPPSVPDSATPDIRSSDYDAAIPDSPEPKRDVDGGTGSGVDGNASSYVEAGTRLATLDTGIANSSSDIPSLEWVAVMQFNEVLAQLPNSAAGLSAIVRLTSMSLISTADLGFIDTVEVFLSHGSAMTDGGVVASSDAQDPGIADGGSASIPSCKVARSSLLVATFRRSETDTSGTSISLVTINPDLNLFDCMKSEPAQFDVRLTPVLGTYPAADTPLTLSTCIGAETHWGYP
jgi:hypothetical protein